MVLAYSFRFQKPTNAKPETVMGKLNRHIGSRQADHPM